MENDCGGQYQLENHGMVRIESVVVTGIAQEGN